MADQIAEIGNNGGLFRASSGPVAPYRQFSLETGTALGPTDDTFAFAVAENRDVFAIKKSGTGTGTTEVHVLSAASGYSQFSLETGTALGPTDDTFAFALAPNRDVVAIKKSGTGTGTTEVHVLSAASGYSQFSLETGTALGPTDDTFAFAVAENRDVFAIKKSGTGTGTTEVHVLSSGAVSVELVTKFAPTIVFHQNEPFTPCTIEHILQNAVLSGRAALPISGQSMKDSRNFPALAVFKGQLWMAYTQDVLASQLVVSSSGDGMTWSDVAYIPGQSTGTPALAVLGDTLWMVYTDSGSSQLWVTCTTDGLNWQPARQIAGQSTSVPALTLFNNALWMVYSDSDSSQLWVTTSSDGWNWHGADGQQPASQIDGQHTSIPAIAPFANRICMVYRDTNGPRLWASRSLDGWTWKPADIPAPTQDALAAHPSAEFYVAIAESQYPGEGLTAPMYYAVQQFDDCVEVTYLLILAYNGHQTIDALRVGSTFYCILDDFARHQGDLERVTVTISLDGNSILAVCFESHGDASYYSPQQVVVNGTHVLVHSSLNAHGTFNRQITGDWISKYNQPGVADFGDAVGSGGTWTPSEYRLVGLDHADNPVNGQVWAKFAGRLGEHQDNSLTGARYFDGSGLNGPDWVFVKMDTGIASAFGLMPSDATSGDGPTGLGGRLYIRPGNGNRLPSLIPTIRSSENVAEAVSRLVEGYGEAETV